jgi:hypothetical protein
VVVDDIRKDDALHTYEWNMMVDSDVRLVRIRTDEIILSGPVADDEGDFDVHVPRPRRGDPQLLVKVLERSIPPNEFNNPQIRLETFEYKDAREWPNGRSFGLAKRLVVPSYSIEPKFKMLLFPHRHGDSLPEVEWNEGGAAVTVRWADQEDVITFDGGDDGRTRTTITRGGKTLARI